MTPLEAASALAGRHGIRHVEPVVLKDGSNLLIHLSPAPVVVRVATFTGLIRRDPMPYLEREVALVTYLASVGAPVMPPSDLIPPGPHLIGGWAMNAWAFVDHEPGVIPDPATALAALNELHAAMRGFQGAMPYLNPAVDDLDRCLRFGTERGLFTADEATRIAARRDRLIARLRELAPDVQALHGDAFARNSLLTRNVVVWLDLEDCCSGPVAWDLATLARQPPDESVTETVRERLGDETLRTAIALRQIQFDTWIVLHDNRERLMVRASTEYEGQ